MANNIELQLDSDQNTRTLVTFCCTCINRPRNACRS